MELEAGRVPVQSYKLDQLAGVFLQVENEVFVANDHRDGGQDALPVVNDPLVIRKSASDVVPSLAQGFFSNPICQQERATSRKSRVHTTTRAAGKSMLISPTYRTLSGILSTIRSAAAGARASSLARYILAAVFAD